MKVTVGFGIRLTLHPSWDFYNCRRSLFTSSAVLLNRAPGPHPGFENARRRPDYPRGGAPVYEPISRLGSRTTRLPTRGEVAAPRSGRAGGESQYSPPHLWGGRPAAHRPGGGGSAVPAPPLVGRSPRREAAGRVGSRSNPGGWSVDISCLSGRIDLGRPHSRGGRGDRSSLS